VVGIVDNGSNSAAIVVDVADPQVGYTPCGTLEGTARTTAASRSRHHPFPLFLIDLNNGLHHPLLVDGCTCQLIVRQAREMYHVLLHMDGEPCTVQVGLLFIRVDVVCAILSQGVELPRVVEYTVVPLLKVQELL
jgi:hypothetical protein